jgi:uncharacterized membrane protein YdbT with pleckstrin-like domain
MTDSSTLKLRQHPILFIKDSCQLLVLIIAAHWIMSVIPTDFRVAGINIQAALWLVVLAYSILQFANSWLNWQFSRLIVQTGSIEIQTGWLIKNSVSIFYQRLESIQVQQSIIAKWLGFGDLIFIGSGGSQDRFANTPDPEKVKALILRYSQPHA